MGLEKVGREQRAGKEGNWPIWSSSLYQFGVSVVDISKMLKSVCSSFSFSCIIYLHCSLSILCVVCLYVCSKSNQALKLQGQSLAHPFMLPSALYSVSGSWLVSESSTLNDRHRSKMEMWSSHHEGDFLNGRRALKRGVVQAGAI